MKKSETLNDFVQNIIKYLGSGYKYYKVVKIPRKKHHKIAQICEKIEKRYQTSLTRGKRQYKRKKGLANYGAVIFRDTIVILRTNGKNNDKKDEFKPFKNKNLNVEISEHLGLIFFKNEFDRFTVRLDRLTFRRFREDFYIAIKNNQKRNYDKLKSMWLNLPRYKGIGRQGKELNKQIKEQLKTFKKNWKSLY